MFTTSLTARQKQVLAFVEQYRSERGVPPTMREVQQAFGFASVNAAAGHLAAIEKKGFLRRARGRARSMALPMLPMARTEGVFSEIPIFGTIPAGFAVASEQETLGSLRVDLDSLKIRRSAETFALRVRGDSMEGAHIVEGDIVILETREPQAGEIVAALIDGETTLKRLVNDGGQFFLRAENPRYPDLLPVGELSVQGVVRAVIRQVTS